MSLHLCKMSKTTFETGSGVFPLFIWSLIFRLAVDCGEPVWSAEGGCPSPSLEFSRCSPLAFESRIDFGQVLDEEVITVVSLAY